MMRKSLFFLFLLLAAFASAQTEPSGSSRVNEAINSVADLIRTRVAGTDDETKAKKAASNPIHLVFLVDTSHPEKDDYVEFTSKFINGLLKSLGDDQGRIQARNSSLHEVSYFPYRMDLIADSSRAMGDSRTLKPGAGIGKTIDDLLRHEPSGEPYIGHRSALSRQSLLKRIGPGKGPREQVIVQITSRKFDKDRSDASVQNGDSHGDGLEGTDYVAYDDGSRLWEIDPTDKNVPPSDAFIWVYGPSSFELPPADHHDDPVTPITDPNEKPVTPVKPIQEDKGSNLPLILGVAILVLLPAGYVVYRLVTKFPVKVGGEMAKVGVMAPLAVKTPGGKQKDGVVTIPKERQGSLGPDLKIGEITVPFLFGGPQVFGSGGYSMKMSSATAAAPQPLSKKPIQVTFSKADMATDPISISL